MSAQKTSVSAYLLRQGVRDEVEQEFDERTPLANGLEGWFHLVEPQRKAPLWVEAMEPYLERGYFQDVESEVPAGLALLLRGGHVFVVTFGFAWIYLKDSWLVPDFGRRVVLNVVPPEEVLELNSEQVFARRHVARERSPKPTTFASFGVDLDRDLVAALEGKPDEALFGTIVRGSTGLRVKIPFQTLPAVLDRAAILFASTAYKRRWPDIDNLTPLTDPATIGQLDDQLDTDMKSGVADRDITMCAPSFRRGEADAATSFVLGRLSKNPATLTYLQYSAWKRELQQSSIPVSVEAARSSKVHMLDHAGDAFEHRSIYECLGYELSLAGQSYVLSSGLWYGTERKFTTAINRTISGLTSSKVTLLPWNTTDDEATYNVACCKGTAMILMDKKLVHYGGQQSKFEFCDFLNVRERTLFCAKIPTRSSDCSHLVEQCRRTLELLFSSDPGFRNTAIKVIAKQHPSLNTAWLQSRPKPGEWNICLVLMGKAVGKLPLFARCSITRLAKYCDEHGHPFHVQSV